MYVQEVKIGAFYLSVLVQLEDDVSAYPLPGSSSSKDLAEDSKVNLEHLPA